MLWCRDWFSLTGASGLWRGGGQKAGNCKWDVFLANLFLSGGQEVWNLVKVGPGEVVLRRGLWKWRVFQNPMEVSGSLLRAGRAVEYSGIWCLGSD